MIISGFTTFAPKFVEAQFNISAGLAAQLIGQSNQVNNFLNINQTLIMYV